MNPDSLEDDLLIRYLDSSATEEDRRRALELLLYSPQARARLVDLAGQMVHLTDHLQAYAEPNTDHLEETTCTIASQPVDVAISGKNIVKQPGQWPGVLRRRRFAASLLFMASLVLGAIALLGKPALRLQPEAGMQLTDYLGQLTVHHGDRDFKSPLQDLPRLTAGDTVESQNFLSWAEFKLDSGAVLTVPVSSKISIRSLTKERMELDVISGAVRVKSAPDDPVQVVIRSERFHVTTAGSETLVFDYNFSTGTTACFTGTAQVASHDESQQVQVNAGWMASVDYNDSRLRLTPHPKTINHWSTTGMKPTELGTGIWKNSAEPGQVKLLAAPKMYIYPDGAPHQIQEILLAVWRRPGMFRLEGGSRLIVSGRTAKPGPVSFALRTHSEYGKLLDVFVKTIAAQSLAAPGESWRVDIPVEEMSSTFRPGLTPLGSLLFNISIFTNDEIGLEVNSVELKPPG